jgi:hypothetical protein
MSVHVGGDGSAAPGISPRENSRQLEGEIAVLRDELTGLVAELDRRRHELTDFKLQARRHVLGVTLTGASLLASAAGFVWLSVWRSRRRSQATARMGRLREAVSRMVDRPDRAAAEPGIPARILTAAANAAVATAIKKVLERSLQRVVLTEVSEPVSGVPPGALCGTNPSSSLQGRGGQNRWGSADRPPVRPVL